MRIGVADVEEEGLTGIARLQESDRFIRHIFGDVSSPYPRAALLDVGRDPFVATLHGKPEIPIVSPWTLIVLSDVPFPDRPHR